MNSEEASVVQQNFAHLVRQGKAEELLDDLFSDGAIDLDDYQRVCAQLTDSDKMRMLLTIVLKKVPTAGVDTFGALVAAFAGANRPDLADALVRYRQQIRGRHARGNTGQGDGVRSSSTQPKFSFSADSTGHKVTTNSGVDKGMDVADCIANAGEITSGTRLANPSLEFSPPTTGVDDQTELLTVSSKELMQAVESAKGTSGQVLLGGHVLTYAINGEFKDNRLEWIVRVTDLTTRKTVEKKSSDNRHETLEKCLQEFIK